MVITQEDTMMMIELLEDIMGTHSSVDSCDYNECDIDPCQWCDDARRVLENIKRT